MSPFLLMPTGAHVGAAALPRQRAGEQENPRLASPMAYRTSRVWCVCAFGTEKYRVRDLAWGGNLKSAVLYAGNLTESV